MEIKFNADLLFLQPLGIRQDDEDSVSASPGGRTPEGAPGPENQEDRLELSGVVPTLGEDEKVLGAADSLPGQGTGERQEEAGACSDSGLPAGEPSRPVEATAEAGARKGPRKASHARSAGGGVPVDAGAGKRAPVEHLWKAGHSEEEGGEGSSEAADQLELTEEEQAEVERLRKRDQEVRAHEQTHVAAGGQYVRGGAQYEYDSGPDRRRYAVGGEVQVETSEVSGDPQATILKAQTVRRAALAPAKPSSTDRRAAAAASRMETKARQDLVEERLQEMEGGEDRGEINAETLKGLGATGAGETIEGPGAEEKENGAQHVHPRMDSEPGARDSAGALAEPSPDAGLPLVGDTGLTERQDGLVGVGPDAPSESEDKGDVKGPDQKRSASRPPSGPSTARLDEGGRTLPGQVVDVYR